MKTVAVPGFGGPTYLAVSPVMNAERAINLYPEPGSEHSKSPMSLVGRPGLSASPFITLPTSPVRGLWAGNNRLFAVAGNNLYEISNVGTIITNYGAMGGSNVGNVQIIANGTQLLVMNGANSVVYNANPGGPSMDIEFNGGIALEYLDGFYITIDGAGDNKVNVSSYLDGTSWNALDTVQRTGGADKPVQLAVLNGQLWIFGQSTIEVWYNAGNPLFPFARVPGATLNLGCIAAFSVVKFDNTILWLGSSPTGFVQVYATEGTSPKRVSTWAIENQIMGITAAAPAGIGATLEFTKAYGYQESGHTFYVLTMFTSHSQPVGQYVYDLTTGMWHERTYAGPFPTCYANVPGFTFSSTGPSYVGDGLSGKIYYQGQGYPSDGGTPIVYTRTFPHIADRNHFIKYGLLELDCDIGTAQVALEYSNDGGKTFPLTRAAISGSAETSNGGFARFRWQQLGRSRDRVFKFVITTATNLIRLVNAYVGVTPGVEP